MQVSNVLHVACWKYRMQKKWRKKLPSGHHRTALLGWIFATEACISNRKNLLHQYLLHTSPQYGELWPTSVWNRFGSLGHPSEFQRLSLLGSVTARHPGSGREPNFLALNYVRHVYLARRPSRWALTNILQDGPKNGATLIFLLSQKLTDFSNFWYPESRRNMTSYNYKFIHRICKNVATVPCEKQRTFIWSKLVPYKTC